LLRVRGSARASQHLIFKAHQILSGGLFNSMSGLAPTNNLVQKLHFMSLRGRKPEANQLIKKDGHAHRFAHPTSESSSG